MEELHFGRVAQRLGLSQPGLTQTIRAIEQAVGTPLDNRTTLVEHFVRAARSCVAA